MARSFAVGLGEMLGETPLTPAPGPRKVVGVMLRRIYRKLLSAFIYRTFNIWQRLGFHVTFSYYGSPVPDTSRLKDDVWSGRSGLVGLDMNEEKQLELLALLGSRFGDECARLPRGRTAAPGEFCLDNPLFRSKDAEVAYCMVRHLRPRKILEMGGGYSTLLLARALGKNREEDADYRCELVTNDPFPRKCLKVKPPAFARVVARRAQDVPLSEFRELAADDILFIDSSHIVKIGSDVRFLVLEVLPRLNRGVVVHFHDVFLPEEYPRDMVVRNQYFFNEQYFVQAFLAFNDGFEILCANSYLKLNCTDRFERAFGSGGSASSLWIVKTE